VCNANIDLGAIQGVNVKGSKLYCSQRRKFYARKTRSIHV